MNPLSQSVPDGVQAIVARYRALVDDPDAFLAAAIAPLPVCLWVNPLKSTAPGLIDTLQKLNVCLESIAWLPGAFRVADWESPGQTLAYTAGWYYVQEEVAMAAVVALDPQPGEHILDMCAAPGGKAAQIALRLQETGMLVANEWQTDRLPSLSVTCNRMGFTNSVITPADGRSLPFTPHSFQRVLVDAPCSGEGNLRRRQHPRAWNPVYSARIASVQQRLLSRALDLVQPGGTVVYSTCTFAPEENEAVLDAVLGDRAYLEPFEIAGLRGQPGLTQWQGQRYRTDVAFARRYWPHSNNTGGFFIARLRRTEAQRCQPEAAINANLEQLVPVELWRDLGDRFGIAPEVLHGYQGWSTGKRRLWLTGPELVPPVGVAPQGLGIALATQTNLGLKPSTAFLQRFSGYFQQNVIELPTFETARHFVQGRTQSFPADVEPGYVHVKFQDFDLGCGRYGHGQLQSQLPKTLRWAVPQGKQ